MVPLPQVEDKYLKKLKDDNADIDNKTRYRSYSMDTTPFKQHKSQKGGSVRQQRPRRRTSTSTDEKNIITNLKRTRSHRTVRELHNEPDDLPIVTLENILRHGPQREVLRMYMQQNYCTENLNFYLEIESLATLLSNTQIKAKSLEIIQRFFTPDSEEEINLSGKTRKEVLEQMESNTTNYQNIFSKAQNEVLDTMKHDTFRNFLESDLYRDYLNSL